jgi:hypothetical protein
VLWRGRSTQYHKQKAGGYALMAAELDDVVDAFAVLEEQARSLSDPIAGAAMREAVNSLLMALGAIELRLNLLESREAEHNPGSGHSTSPVPKSGCVAP